MQQLGTPAFTGKHVQAVVNRYGTRKRGTEEKGAYPLDVGYMTPKQIQELNPQLPLNTIYSRLFAGQRVLAELIKPKVSPRTFTANQQAVLDAMIERAKRARIIKADKAKYYEQRRAAHPPVK